MTERVRRLLCAAVVVAAAVVLTSSVAAPPARVAAKPAHAASPAPVPSHVATSFVELNMNLCNSGMAVNSCYTYGRAVSEAVEKIQEYPPDMVTLQEVCGRDFYRPGGLGQLTAAMAARYGRNEVAVDFVPAWNRYTNSPYRCTNGEEYGIALIHHGTGRDVHHGWYAAQDGSDEERAWTCATVITGRLTGCTTHLSTNHDVGVRECRELESILDSPWVLPQVIVAGDFNLIARPGKPYDAQQCTAPGYDRRSDNALQQVFFSRTVDWQSDLIAPMRFTDHPMLYERFRI